MSNGEEASPDVASEAGNRAIVYRPSPEAIVRAFFLEQCTEHGHTDLHEHDKTMAAICEELACMAKHKSSKGAMVPHAYNLVEGYIPKVLPKKSEPLNSLPLLMYVCMDMCVHELIKRLQRMSKEPCDEAGMYAYTLILSLSCKHEAAMQLCKVLYGTKYPEYTCDKSLFESMEAFILLQRRSLILVKARLSRNEVCMKNIEEARSKIIESMSAQHVQFAVDELERAQLLSEFSV